MSGGIIKTSKFRESHPPGMDMHAAEFGAAVQRGKHLAGIE
jgi:hypothetical protein